MGSIRNQGGQGKLSPGASVPLSPLSPTLAYTVASISRNQEGKGNRIGKGRPSNWTVFGQERITFDFAPGRNDQNAEREKRKGEKREAREEGQGCNKGQRENHLGWGFWLLSLLVKFHCSLCGEPEH